MMTYEEYKKMKYSKGLSYYGVSEEKAQSEYDKIKTSENDRLASEIAAKNEKSEFLNNAIAIIGKEAVIECFIECRKSRAAAEKAIECGNVSPLVRDEIE